MAVNPSRTKMAFDKSALTLLRDPAAAAISTATTTNETPISLKELRSAYWHNFEIPHGVMRIGVSVMTLNVAGTYTFSLLCDDVVAMNNSPVTLATMIFTATGYYEVDLDSKSIPGLDSDHDGTDKFLMARMVTTGTVSITYGAWIGKSTDA